MKKTSYETKLAKNMGTLPAGRWYSIEGRPDYEQFVAAVKGFIDSGAAFEFNGNFTKVRVLRVSDINECYNWQDLPQMPDGYRKEYIPKGFAEQAMIKGHMHLLTHETASYRIYKNDQLIAIEHERN